MSSGSVTTSVGDLWNTPYTCDSESWTTVQLDEIGAQKLTSWELVSTKYVLKFLNTSPRGKPPASCLLFLFWIPPLSRLREPAADDSLRERQAEAARQSRRRRQTVFRMRVFFFSLFFFFVKPSLQVDFCLTIQLRPSFSPSRVLCLLAL